jgi:hypothetical protein
MQLCFPHPASKHKQHMNIATMHSLSVVAAVAGESRAGPVHIVKVPHVADGQDIVISVQVGRTSKCAPGCW